MTTGSALPFGRTSVSKSDISNLTNAERAAELLTEFGHDAPEAAVKSFLGSIPELLQWLEENGRTFPWRETTDAWEVYAAELLLQRTNADAVLRVFPSFIERYPSPAALAEADEDEIRKLVYELGLVDNRLKTLQSVGEQFADGLPDSVSELQEPWGVGEYSARACQLFARRDPQPLVDSNFARVISRVMGIEMPSQPHKSKQVYALMNALTPRDPDVARAFNLGILDLGGVTCTSTNPDCGLCPLNRGCNYYQQSKEETT